ncbi:MAG: HAD family hydrolase [Asgard group archaeon]|nr:HAD family hydrolase [Asgard group archaeon]
MIKCISFDFDRTLSHVVPLTHHYIPKLLKEKGLVISIEEFIEASIELRKNLPSHLVKNFDIYGTLSSEERKQFIFDYNLARIDNLKAQLKIKDYEQTKIWIVEQLMKNQKKILYDDVVETIKKLSEKNYRLFILSGNHSDGIIEILSQAEILHLFEDIITVDKYNSLKTDNFTILLEKTQLAPHEILHIGDDLQTDGKAINYKIKTLIIRRPHQLIFDENENIANYNVIIELSEIFDFLNNDVFIK